MQNHSDDINESKSNEKETDRIINFWKQKDSINFHYFDLADSDEATDGFWRKDGLFRPKFEELNLDAVVEVACGYGRHARRVVDRCGKIFLLDTSVDGLVEASRRLADKAAAVVLPPGDGRTIPLPSGSCTAVFSYDAMVHFEMNDVFSYVSESFRVLKPGGRCLIHHSAYELGIGKKFEHNPGWRNFMCLNAFRHFAIREGFRIISIDLIDWAEPKTDALSLLEK